MSENTQSRRLLTLAVPAALFTAVIAFIGLALSATATPDPHPQPADFGQEPFETTLSLPASFYNRSPVMVENDFIYTETFEVGIAGKQEWNVFDGNDTTVPVDGQYYWGANDFINGPAITGTRSLWSIGDGFDGETLDPISDTYPANVDSWVIYGPIDLSKAKQNGIYLQFDYWFDGTNANANFDLNVALSTNGRDFVGVSEQLDDYAATTDWFTKQYPSALLNDYVGESEVYIGFNFNTTAAGNGKGVFLDNFVLATDNVELIYLPAVRYDQTPTPTITPTPSPTATPVSLDDYEDGFDTSTTGWNVFRRRNYDQTPDNSVKYVDAADDYLEVEVREANDYVVMSPLVPGRPAPFELAAEVEFANTNDTNIFSLIFAGDYNGDPATCPSTNLDECFNEYYALQIRYRDGGTLEYKLVQVTEHDADNDPVETELTGTWNNIPSSSVTADAPNDFLLDVESNGQITFLANGDTIETVPGTRTFEHAYFGAGVATEDISGARVQFYNYFFGEDAGSGAEGNAYNNDFNSSGDVNTWEDVRHTALTTTDNDINFRDDDRDGIMELVVNERQQYFIASPLEAAPQPPYTIESELEFGGTPTDKQEMAIIFSGNVKDSVEDINDCLTNTEVDNCFDNYYGLRIRYRDGGKIEVQLAEMDNHTAENQPDWDDNTGWTLVNENDADGDTWNVWRIEVDNDDNINVFVNGDAVLDDTDSTYFTNDNVYFGLMATSLIEGDDDGTANSRIKANYFRVDGN